MTECFLCGNKKLKEYHYKVFYDSSIICKIYVCPDCGNCFQLKHNENQYIEINKTTFNKYQMLNKRPESVKNILDTISGIKQLKNNSLLDLCCGEGDFTNAASQAGANAYGIDIIENPKISGRNNFFIGDFLKYDFKGKKFDIITCNMSFAYFSDSIAAIKKIYDLLNPSGIFYMKQKSVYYLHALSKKKFIYTLHKNVYPHDYFLGGAKAMKLLFQKGGFEKIKVSGIDENTIAHLKKFNNKIGFAFWYIMAKLNLYGMLNATGFKN
ncbi:MAG TPA: class I SAM-dependent methyltransferase [bacterium]|nr:class I SAM-dependent methyltransferase [bacterium]